VRVSDDAGDADDAYVARVMETLPAGEDLMVPGSVRNDTGTIQTFYSDFRDAQEFEVRSFIRHFPSACIDSGIDWI